ncbi:exonuclease domain-containing protein [Agrococcus jejuensis]|uniref:exonuclease domain-containing protein n=1 Tax=Agrococcus jejuensis TaxID=399736 RepID=UPI0011A6A984|nr:exonuclease domain-containing protein [Agrococcus jejuensis]
MSGYTVIDVETTGFSPAHGDRIVEIAFVLVSERGDVEEQWSTLLDPQRDVGPTRIHGISASDVRGAPRFEEIAPYVLRAIAGRTIVAHNASFDLRFLAAELQRAGVPLEVVPLHGLCTMRWSPTFLSASSRKLVDCCDAAGIPLRSAHSAAADAAATAALLRHYLDAARMTPPWTEELTATRGYRWPAYSGAYPELRLVRRTDIAARREDEWLDAIVSHMPRAADARVDSYLASLELALLDGVLAEHEKEGLVEVALELGLTRGQVLDLHGDYLRAMAEVALADHVVTSEERADLLRIASALGLRPSDVDAALADAADRRADDDTAMALLGRGGIRLSRGDRVVFTGAMVRERGDWEADARALGLVPGGITKTTAIVVAADPNSMSGKAAKARAFGVPIVTEQAFERLLAEMAA